MFSQSALGLILLFSFVSIEIKCKNTVVIKQMMLMFAFEGDTSKQSFSFSLIAKLGF